MLRSLWFKLTLYFSLLFYVFSIFFNSLLVVAIIPSEYRKMFVPEVVADAIREERYILIQLLKHVEDENDFRKIVRKEMTDRLRNLSVPDPEPGLELSLKDVSKPKIFFKIVDVSGSVVCSSPENWTQLEENAFAALQTEYGQTGNGDTAVSLERQGQIWTSLTVKGFDNTVYGRIDLLLIGEFNYFVMLTTYFAYLWHQFFYLLAIYLFASLPCGLLANRFVTGRLKNMHSVTSAWRKGDFSPRIHVHEKSSDVLARHSRTLNRMADELQSLLKLRYQAAVLEERTRMARELHDTVKQNLFALKLQLAVTEKKIHNPDIAKLIHEAQKITHEAQQDINAILVQLTPEQSSATGLFGHLTDIAEDMRRRYGLVVVWERQEPVALPPDEERNLIRIGQEAMSNAARHGRATQMVMSLFQKDGFMWWKVSDNGCGMPESRSLRHATGLGLTIMRERTATLPDGLFSIGASPSGGVEIMVKWRIG